MSTRLLLIFARSPGSEARDKGLPREPAARFFAEIAHGWRRAARGVGASVVVCAPPEDLPAWRRALPEERDLLWMEQRGTSFGLRLEDSVRRASALARHVVVTGGDVVPAPAVLAAAFDALDSGVDAVVAPAPDGGVSLLAIPETDADLLRPIARRHRGVARWLRRRLASRGRTIAVVDSIGDVDRAAALRTIELPAGLVELALLLRRACKHVPPPEEPPRSAPRDAPTSAALLRGPPLAA